EELVEEIDDVRVALHGPEARPGGAARPARSGAALGRAHDGQRGAARLGLDREEAIDDRAAAAASGARAAGLSDLLAGACAGPAGGADRSVGDPMAVTDQHDASRSNGSYMKVN